MQNELAFLACGSPFSGGEAFLLMAGLISLLLGVIFALSNLIMLCVLYYRGGPVGAHLVGCLAYIASGVFVIMGLLENFNIAVISIIALAIIAFFHLVLLRDILGRTRPSKTEPYDARSPQQPPTNSDTDAQSLF